MNANQPAYPMPSHSGPTGELATPHFGITKRELIAAMALQGILANANSEEFTEYLNVHAEMATEAADALLAKLQETNLYDHQHDH